MKPFAQLITPLFGKLLSGTMPAIVAIQLVLQPAAFALKIEIRSDIKLRENQDGQMEHIGVLRKGTIVEIPDEYTVAKDGAPDLELTLNNWLRSGGLAENEDYYFPIRLNQAAEGSTVEQGRENSQYYIALKHLVREGAAFTVTDDAPLMTRRSLSSARPPGDSDPSEATTSLHAKSSCADGRCRVSEPSYKVRGLLAALAPALSQANRGANKIFNRTNQDLRHVYSKFQNTCGFSLGEFIPIVKSRAAQAGIPAEILLALMTQESSGRCYEPGREPNGTHSVGLFQINSVGKSYPMCTAAQIKTLRGIVRASRLASGPRCLDNPLINLDEAIRNLKESKRLLTTARGAFDSEEMQGDDLWRAVVASYNGGVKWVLKAKQDLEAFNARNGTNLSASHWEDLRIFFMRSWLDRGTRASLIGGTHEGRRKEFAISNLAYAENIIGRPATAQSRPGLTTAWTASVRN